MIWHDLWHIKGVIYEIWLIWYMIIDIWLLIYDMWYVTYAMICYALIWYDMIWYDTMWVIWYDMIWYDMIRYDMIWYDMKRYDMIWYDMISWWWWWWWWYICFWWVWYDMSFGDGFFAYLKDAGYQSDWPSRFKCFWGLNGEQLHVFLKTLSDIRFIWLTCRLWFEFPTGEKWDFIREIWDCFSAEHLRQHWDWTR